MGKPWHLRPLDPQEATGDRTFQYFPAVIYNFILHRYFSPRLCGGKQCLETMADKKGDLYKVFQFRWHQTGSALLHAGIARPRFMLRKMVSQAPQTSARRTYLMFARACRSFDPGSVGGWNGLIAVSLMEEHPARLP